MSKPSRVGQASAGLAGRGLLDLEDMRLEYRMIGPPPGAAPTIVLLHEGLGAAESWGGFATALAEATGAGVFAYSRAGYGASSAAKLPRSVSFMDEEACDVLARLLDAIGFQRGFLLGHSDGASIATIYAGSVADHRVRGLVLIAPHFFTEDMGLAEIRRTKQAFESGALRAKLSRVHADADNAFHNWCDPWLDPQFRRLDLGDALAHIRVPMLIIQGTDDQYGTGGQIEFAQQECYCPVEVELLPGTRHAPHLEAPEPTLRTISQFYNRLVHDHEEGAALSPAEEHESPAGQPSRARL